MYTSANDELKTQLSIFSLHFIPLRFLLIANITGPSNNTRNRTRSGNRTRRRLRNRRTCRSCPNETRAGAGDFARSSQSKTDLYPANGESEIKLALAYGELGRASGVVEGVGRHWVIICVVSATRRLVVRQARYANREFGIEG